MSEEGRERIDRIRRRYREEVPVVSIERARYFTEAWKDEEENRLAPGVRVAIAMKNVYEKMNHYVDPDDRIAGTWTENFLGIPLDIERGLFNLTLEVEMEKRTMLSYLLASNARFIWYMIRKYGPAALFRSLKESRAVGAAMPSLGLDPMNRRKVNPYRILPRDKRILKKELLPYWKGRTIADMLRDELKEQGIFGSDLAGFFAALPSTTSRNDTILSPGAAIGTWQGHLIPDYQTVLEKGLEDMHREVLERLQEDGSRPEEKDFLASMALALEGAMIFARRLAERLEQMAENEKDLERREIYTRMLETCRNVPLKPARTFREAVQSFWTTKTALDLALPFNVHAPGRLDQMFYPYYERDKKDGAIAADEAKELLEELFLKIMSHNMRPYSNFTSYFTQRYEGSEPVTMGGLTPEGRDATNELTYLMLDAAADSKAALNFVVRLHENSPEELYLKVAELLAAGNSSISMMNDTVCIDALRKRKIGDEDARNFAITGCVDMCVPGKTGGEAFSALLLCRILDMTLRNGDSRTLIGIVEGAGPRTGHPDGFSTFQELVDAFIDQVSHQLKKIIEATRIRDRLYAEHLPAPHISAFIQGCQEKRRDVTKGGAVLDLEGILTMNSIANLVDSLYVIKKCIFEQGKFTIRELLRAVDHNFEGYEEIYRAIHEVKGKWGNGNPECDALAREVTSRIFEEMYKYRTFKGGFYAPFINSMTTHTYDGRISLATPDGRKAAKPYAASCNPYNVERRGITGVLRSVAALDFSHVLGCAVNIRMHPTGIGKTEEARRKWVSLVRTYFQMGGMQLQPTVVSTEMLRNAQADPGAHRDIIIKVGGYSAYFTDLGREIQEEIISRTQHGML